MNKKYFYTFVVALLTMMSISSMAATTLFGYQMGNRKSKYGFVSFTSDNFSTTTILKSTSLYYNHVSAGEFFDGKLYTYRVEPDDMGGLLESCSFTIYDAETFKELKNVDRYGDVRVVDMTYDYTTNTMYALAETKVVQDKIETTQLCVVNLEDGSLTPVGSAGNLRAIDGYNRDVEAVLVALAADKDGNLYAMTDYRQLYSLDKFTGKATFIGQHHLVTDNQFQSMTFASDGTLYWSQQGPSTGNLATVDVKTGDATNLGTLNDDAQITALFEKKEAQKDFPLAVEGLTAKIDDSSHNTVHLSWTNPTKDYADNDVSLKEIRIYRFGNSEPLAILSGEATSFVDESAPNGTSTYEVVPVSEKACGRPATVSVFAGYDQLKSVGNIAISLNGKTVSLSWSAPTATVNGGYSDYDNITYNIYRNKADKQTLVGENIKALTFTDNLEEAGAYTYTIVPLSGGVEGMPATSDIVKLLETYTIPYFTGFEDDGDGPLWNFINAEHSSKTYGWSIDEGSVYSRLDGKFAQLKSGGSSDHCDDWLMSPPIHFEKGDYTLKYNANGQKYDTHSWEVLLGTDRNDTTTFKQSIARYVDEKAPDWKTVYEKEFSVSEAGDYFLGFHGTTTSIYATLKIDNLSITANTESSVKNLITDGSVINFRNGMLNLVSNAGVKSWNIANAQGQIVAAGLANGSTAISTSVLNVQKGLFIVTVNLANGKRITKKMIVK